MDGSFRSRVDNIFGALGPPSSSSSTSPSQPPPLRSLWSLSDAEVEKKKWLNRPQQHSHTTEEDDDDYNPSSSSFTIGGGGGGGGGGLFSNKKPSNIRKKGFEEDLDDLDDLDDEEEDDDDDKPLQKQQQGPTSSNQSFEVEEEEEEDIRSSIGLDPTLDNEEEEDEYDKVAVGRENAGERTFMKDVEAHGPYLNSHNVLPNSFKDHTSDTRADRLSAINRLREDITAETFLSHPSPHSTQVVGIDPGVPVKAANHDVGNPKPILKRKENKSDSKSQKRVRFDPGCKDTTTTYDQGSESPVSPMVTCSMDTVAEEPPLSLMPQYAASGVPDYVRNPSKYTKYSFDSSSEVSEQSNQQAYMDFLNAIRRSENTQSGTEGTVSLPKSITFTPKKKASDGEQAKKDSDMKQSEDDTAKGGAIRIPLSIAGEETMEACPMEEDEQTTRKDTIGSSRKAGRQYRSKNSFEDTAS